MRATDTIDCLQCQIRPAGDDGDSVAMKNALKVFFQKDLKKSVGIAITSVNHHTDSKYSNYQQTARRGIQLLPDGLSASGFTAKPLS